MDWCCWQRDGWRRRAPEEIFARTDLSLASRDDVGVMLSATLSHYDEHEQMATLRLGEQTLMVTMEHAR
jgi:molybdate transport system ATP-binding protein